MNKKQPSSKTSLVSIIGFILVCIIGFVLNQNGDNRQSTNVGNDSSVVQSDESNIDNSSLYEAKNDDSNETTSLENNEQKSDSSISEKTLNDTDENHSEKKYSFRNDSYLTQHFEKHGNEFNYSSKEEYEEGARKVITSDKALHKTEAEDGDDVYYIEETNEFVIVSTDGYIRTYFRPKDGIRYFNRQ